jgi:para-aminobenzoate synthetase component 1
MSSLAPSQVAYESAAIVQRLNPTPDPLECFIRLARRPACVFFDSALRHPTLGRFSFLSADPFERIECASPDAAALDAIDRAVARFAQPSLAGLPPFQGGVAGCIGYDFLHALESIPRPRFDEFRVPCLSLGLYDVVLAWDHELDEAWLISQGWPEPEPSRRRQRAAQRLAQFSAWLDEPMFGRERGVSARYQLPHTALAPQFPAGGLAELSSNFSGADYLRAIRRAVEYIEAGDMFQVNLSQRLLHPAHCSSAELYAALRQVNPAPFAGYFDWGTEQIVSASPERFFSLRQGRVEARPIKGTRRRSGFPESDLVSGYELMTCEKDRAENVMIVDLLRNDLSRCCEDDSIEVTQLCGLEKFPTVLHLVSAIQGRLRAGCTVGELLRAVFPGGSVTGAPKVRAMEIISELEPTARGPYCGSLAYFGFDGTADANILIRTIAAARGWWQIPVGGGIVAQSDPRREYDETWAKAAGLLRAVHATRRGCGRPEQATR